MENLLAAKSETVAKAAVTAESNLFEAIRGVSHAGDSHGAVVGINDNQTPTAGPGVYGKSSGTGVWGESETWMGVYGHSNSTTGGAGVMGENEKGPGIIGKSKAWVGVYGETEGLVNGPAGVWGEHKGDGVGVKAVSKNGAGLAAYSNGSEAVHAETQSATTASIAAYNLNPTATGAAIFAKKEGDHGHAGFFEGEVWVSKTLTVGVDLVLANADFAEDFDILDNLVEPGAVMVLSTNGGLKQSTDAYDKKVAGVISGAGTYKPGIVLDRQSDRENRKPLAMVGKVYCKVDATYGPIEVGDLLTSSETVGHAMKVTDQSKAFGAIIGKSLGTLQSGTGLIPILVSLQ